MIDLIADAGTLPPNKPSTVIDITQPEIKVLRRGDLVTGDFETMISKSEKDTMKIGEFMARKVLKSPVDRPIIFGLSGDLGCGKTVFSRGVGKALGVKEKITSPTFVIYNEYDLSNLTFLHFDIYRLSGKHEFEEINFLEQFREKVIACIEWPENMGEEIYKKLKDKSWYIPVNFRYVDSETRELKFRID